MVKRRLRRSRPRNRLQRKADGRPKHERPQPEQLAKVLSILTGDEFTPDELFSDAHVLLVLAPDDPRRERLYLAVLRGQEAQEAGIAELSSGTS